ncbi:hypothetical protein CK203_114060 [Vitis vinifera]|uniref:Uncharacterized protein n=1 Tax=Vitis vinifera TaxID=29760 RepID=A0A438EPJ8_VITVI|nr:hypothetical protein CK203_114060 [Vitis vinifera]
MLSFIVKEGILIPQAPASAPLPPKPKKASPLNSHAPSTSTTVSVDSCEATGKALESPNCSGKQRLGLCMVFDTRSNAFRIYSGRNRNA